MPKSESDDGSKPAIQKQRRFVKEFKEEAVQMLLDGHSATSVARPRNPIHLRESK